MWKKIRRILMIVLAVIFIFCAGTVAVVQHQYQVAKRLYADASSQFTGTDAVPVSKPAASSSEKTEEDPGLMVSEVWEKDGIFRLKETAPKKVNFDDLLDVNGDVTGWIYCPGTVIDYPVMHGETNDTYINTTYDRKWNNAGSIFVSAENARNFVDSNTVIYGHHMSSGSMFAILDHWQNGEFWSEHPEMWLMTPTQDYKIELFSAYNTSAYDDVYQFINAPAADVLDFLNHVKSLSAVAVNMDLDPYAHYVMLSTCAYVFQDARSVIHGKLVPVSSIAGVPVDEIPVKQMMQTAAKMTQPPAEATTPSA